MTQENLIYAEGLLNTLQSQWLDETNTPTLYSVLSFSRPSAFLFWENGGVYSEK